MNSAIKLERHFARLKEACSKSFPEAIIELRYFRITHFSLRIIVAEDLFIDVYYNAENERQSYTLIKGDHRVFGYDNLSGWHCHPLEEPEKHLPCRRKPLLRKIFLDLEKAVKTAR